MPPPPDQTAAGPLDYEPVLLLALGTAVLFWSGIAPHDRLTWVLEVAPVLIAVPLMLATRRNFPLTMLLYRLAFLHAVILMVGGRYTYALAPPGFWLQDLLELSRNHYDRLGHFAQGFVPAILAREILWRRSPLRGSRWLPVFVVSVCLAFSALYEMIEWWSAVIIGEAADAFLGTQGDPWDTQWDMFLALTGAVAALVFLSGTHTRALERLRRAGDRPSPPEIDRA
jgi:putative membrane protein